MAGPGNSVGGGDTPVSFMLCRFPWKTSKPSDRLNQAGVTMDAPERFSSAYNKAT